jgi:hypothetical protein
MGFSENLGWVTPCPHFTKLEKSIQQQSCNLAIHLPHLTPRGPFVRSRIDKVIKHQNVEFFLFDHAQAGIVR